MVVCVVCVLVTGLAWADDPNESGEETICYPVFGTTEDTGACPSWNWVFSRNGTDGGQLTVEVDGCQIVTLGHFPKPQSRGAGKIADLEINDIFIEWDEDQGHGDGTETFFEFTGTYEVAEPNEYVKVTTTDSRTEWTVYRVTSSGTLSKTSDCCNEHDAIRLQRNWLEFTKDANDLDCRSEGQMIEYTICWDNNSIYTFYDCYIIDWLPEGVTYPGSTWQIIFDPNMTLVPPDPAYDPNTHSYAYLDIGTIAPGDANCVTLEVVVNDTAEPGLYLHNVADLYDSNSLIARDVNDVLVCCQTTGDPNIVYVDINATGSDTGVDWQNAYSGRDGVAKALARIRNTECVPGPNTIYVSQGIYDPNNTPDDTFALPDNCSVYGGFKSGDTFSQRDPKKYETILTGDFDNDGFPDVDSVVTMGDETLLDGFTVTQTTLPSGRCIYGNGVDFNIENCTVKNSGGYGIQAEGGDVTVKWCKVLLNNSDGVYHTAAGYTLTVENSWLLRNGECGIWSRNSTPTVKNSIVSESSFIKAANAGIRIENPSGKPKLHNLTISNNRAEGISLIVDNDPNYFKEENSANRIEIQNCIVYFNNGNGAQFSPKLDLNLDRVAHHSCIADCNSVNGNTSAVPKFAYLIDDPNGMPDPNGVPDPNNYHLHFDDIVCKDAGDPNGVYTGQVDMDGEGINRIVGTQIDIGADEIYSCSGSDANDISNALDWDADGLVNLVEFNRFQKAWLSHDPNDPALTDPNYPMHGPYNDANSIYYVSDSMKDNWDSVCDLDPNGTSIYVIDLKDLSIFWWDNVNDKKNWLWKACWKDDGLYETMGMSGGGESMMSIPIETFAVESEYTETESALSEVEWEETDPYAEMSNTELAWFVKGIFEVIDSIETSIDQDHENAENLLEAKEFLEEVLSDIEASRQ
jgi:uncharacterized repeat protein (TIGR01451 family)